MNENDINAMMNQKPEDMKQEIVNKENNNYGEEPFYKNIHFDAATINVPNPAPFTVYSETEIPDNIEERIMTILPMLQKNKSTMRMGGDNRNTLEMATAHLYMFKEIYLAWANSNKDLAPSATRKKPSEIAYRVAVSSFLNSRREATEEKFNDLPFAIKALLAKDSHILYGDKLDSKLGMIIIYTPCGSTSFAFNQDFKALGRASNWITYGRKFGIKIYNLGDDDSYAELKMTLAGAVSTPKIEESVTVEEPVVVPETTHTITPAPTPDGMSDSPAIDSAITDAIDRL